MSIFDVSCDPNKPLSIEEFKLAFDTWLNGIVSTDEEIHQSISKHQHELTPAIKEAIRAERFAIYKKIFWDELKHADYDP